MREHTRGWPMSDDRLGWHHFYAKRFDAHVAAGRSSAHAEQLAIWYLFLHLLED